MLNRLIIGEPDAARRAEWEQAFRTVEGVDIRDLDARSLMGLSEVDAVLMLGMMAHEHFGGRPIPDQAQILSSRSRPGLPPWIVTTAPQPARIEKTAAGSRVVPARTISPAEDTLNVFTKAFHAIEDFNTRHETPIGTLAFSPAILNMRGDLRDEIAAVKQSWLERGKPDTGPGSQPA